MKKYHLLLRNLRYFSGVNLAVILGMAVATAVLTGALMVGDSVRGSLGDLALRRLGSVDYALNSTRFFDESLAARINADNAGVPGVATPALIVTGGAQAGDSRTADVQIAAMGSPGGKLEPAGGADLQLPGGTCIVNGELAGGLGVAKTGSAITLSAPAGSDVPRESALSRRGRNDVLNQLNASVKRIETEPDFISLFSLGASQRVSRNAWVNLKDLQDATEQPGRVNGMLVAMELDRGKPYAPDIFTKALNDRLRKVIRLDDYGLTVKPVGDNESSVFARDTYIAPPVADAAKAAAGALHIHLREVNVDLVTSVANISTADGKPKVIHYAVGAGITSLDNGALAENEIAINQWMGDQLGAKVGDKLSIDFDLRQAGGDLADASKSLPKDRLTFVVKSILPMSGLGADPKLPPDYKGLTDAESVADWNPPEGLTIDKKLVTKADEDYWHTWHAAPKLFLNFEAARKLWGGPYGNVTGLRIPTADADRFSARLLSELKPESVGLVFRPIKAEQLASANGGTDFSMFFVMFSFFLIVAAALLVAMLFRLNIEQRARQLGLMSAVGFSPSALRRLSLGEGMILAVIGGIIGLAGAIGYTSLIMYGLRTWWIGAVGTTAMMLHIVPLTLVYGLVGSLFVAFLAILWAVWRVGKAQPARLLAGGWGMNICKPAEGRWARWIGIGCTVIGLIIVAIAIGGKISVEQGFGGGGLLLCGWLAWLGSILRPRRHGGASFAGAGSLTRLGIRNAARHTARGVLSVGLIAVAAYALITVAAMKQNGIADLDNKNSETGGYQLVLNAGIPLTGDLNSPAGRKLLGFTNPNDPIYTGVHFTMIRKWQGQDISCLNLTKPNSPTILGLPPEMIARGGFIPAKTIDKQIPFWSILNSDQNGNIPVIADSDTKEYVLQMELTGTIPITDQLGVPRQLELAATIAHSIFQGQLLMSDANFLKLFPAQSGFGVVLVDIPRNGNTPEEFADRQAEVAKKLSSELGDYSVSVDTAVARLKTYQNVQNTYLETFQTLGALGLMLGTLGLAVVLVRTVIERKAELALLASLGFSAAARVTLVLSENAFLLVLGLVLGTISAVIGIIPVVLREARPINFPYLFGTLGIVLVVGLVSSAIAVTISGVHVTPADLRRE